MSRHHFEGLLFPAPVLQHLARGLDEVPLDTGAGEPLGVSPGADEVHHVTEFVEEGLHLAANGVTTLYGETCTNYHGQHVHWKLKSLPLPSQLLCLCLYYLG